MIVQMVYQMSGGRYDGRSWPLMGTDFEVPDDEGQGLVGCGAAVYRGPSVVAAPPQPEPAVKPEHAVESELVPDDAEPGAAEMDAAVSEELATKQSLPRPAPGDPKLAWVLYAVSQGASRSEAEESTKVQLLATYGGGGRL